MSSYEENYLNLRPQSLCKMCGRCCKVVTTSTPYPKLLEMFENGYEPAVDFLSIFEPFKSVEDARKADAGVVDNIIALLKEDGNYNEDELTFYTCKYLQEDNKCSNYENRPKLCRHCPSTPWSIVPPGCGFEGWLFWRREEDKQKIRRAKEELLELKLLRKKTKSPESLKRIDIVEQKIQKNIDAYKKYGSELW